MTAPTIGRAAVRMGTITAAMAIPTDPAVTITAVTGIHTDPVPTGELIAAP